MWIPIFSLLALVVAFLVIVVIQVVRRKPMDPEIKWFLGILVVLVVITLVNIIMT